MPHALILGASRGLGLGLAKEFASRGWDVTGTIRSGKDRAALEAAGATAALADITDPASLAALHATVPAGLGLLFVNAGISEAQGPESATQEEIGHLFLTNAVAPIRAAQALIDRLAPDGVLAFMSSQLGSVARNRPGNKELYGASKAALNALTRNLADRLDPKRPVLSLHPGWVQTDMGGANAAVDVPTSVRGLADVILAHQGKPGSAFLDYTGATLPW